MAGPRPAPRAATLRKFVHPSTGDVIDNGIALWFPAPASFTGEDIAELQLHGGRAVVKAVLTALAEIPGCRMAEPGEFARRAFENGRIDLAEAEGLADLIEAETEGQRRQALRQASGTLSALYEGWRRTLIDATALVEASIDFSDEGDVGIRAFDQAHGVVSALSQSIRRHLDDGHRGEILRNGFQVVLAGPPNVGKSSLLNALARRDVAIVSEEPGTTRDILEVHLDLDGFPVVIMDTAGIRESVGKVESEGIRRALARAESVDLVIWLMDAAGTIEEPPPGFRDRADRMLRVVNKVDLLPEGIPPRLEAGSIAISVKTGIGLPELTRRLAGIAAERIGPNEDPVITQTRHRQLIEACAESLSDFLSQEPSQVELRAEDLRRGAHALGRVTGRVDVEDVLDQVFKRFCIGK